MSGKFYFISSNGVSLVTYDDPIDKNNGSDHFISIQNSQGQWVVVENQINMGNDSTDTSVNNTQISTNNLSTYLLINRSYYMYKYI